MKNADCGCEDVCCFFDSRSLSLKRLCANGEVDVTGDGSVSVRGLVAGRGLSVSSRLMRISARYNQRVAIGV